MKGAATGTGAARSKCDDGNAAGGTLLGRLPGRAGRVRKRMAAKRATCVRRRECEDRDSRSQRLRDHGLVQGDGTAAATSNAWMTGTRTTATRLPQRLHERRGVWDGHRRPGAMRRREFGRSRYLLRTARAIPGAAISHRRWPEQCDDAVTHFRGRLPCDRQQESEATNPVLRVGVPGQRAVCGASRVDFEIVGVRGSCLPASR